VRKPCTVALMPADGASAGGVDATLNRPNRFEFPRSAHLPAEVPVHWDRATVGERGLEANSRYGFMSSHSGLLYTDL